MENYSHIPTVEKPKVLTHTLIISNEYLQPELYATLHYQPLKKRIFVYHFTFNGVLCAPVFAEESTKHHEKKIMYFLN